MIFSKSYSDVVDGILNKSSLWNVYSIKKSIPDGHCLLHSVVESLKSQKGRPEPLTVEELLYLVSDETTAHVDCYSQFLIESVRDNSYIYDELYNTPYGDLVPLVLAIAPNMNIVTISEGIQGRMRRREKYIFLKHQPITMHYSKTRISPLDTVMM